jgi:alpha-N-arabinofuranosidase
MQSPNRRTFLRQSSSLALASLLPSSIYQGTPFAKTVKAKVHVNFEKPIGKIEPEIYGQFIEYLGRAITGGVVDAKTSQVRKDVLEKIKRLQTPLLRFPGGTVTKIYHWQDGIGPKICVLFDQTSFGVAKKATNLVLMSLSIIVGRSKLTHFWWSI